MFKNKFNLGIFIILFLTGFADIFAQDTEESVLTFSKVIQTEGVNTETVYSNVRTWFSLATKDANKVLTMDDKESGVLIGNTNMKYSYGNVTYSAYDGWIEFAIQVTIRDGRLRVEVKNFTHKKSNSKAAVPDFGVITNVEESPFNKGLNKGPNQKVWDDIKKKAENISEKIFMSIEKSIHSNTSNEEW